MAADLFIESLSYDQLRFLKDAHGTVGEVIYHADRGWHQYEHVLRTRLAAGPPSGRALLPAHGYVTFKATDRTDLAHYVAASPINKARLGNVLEKVSRPLGMVTANPGLGAWNPALGLGRVDILIAALNGGNVIIEYYKVDGSPILTVHTGWQKVDE
jgi:hypothetical protein